MEYNLSKYAEAMSNLTYKDEKYGHANVEIRFARSQIAEIINDDCGPYTENVKKLRRFCGMTKVNVDAKFDVEIGMSEVEVLFARFYPSKINTTQTANGTSKQYVYDDGYYVYVENGKVTAIQHQDGSFAGAVVVRERRNFPTSARPWHGRSQPGRQ